MLTLNDFNDLDDDGKAQAVWAGAFLADRSEEVYIIQLYALGGFYVEVSYDQQANRIDAFRAFENLQELVPYLAKMGIV